jgi:hypothetical protein
VIRGNFIHDNNNPNTPGAGLTAVSAVGTGIEMAATQHISMINNRIENQGAWGIVTHDLPDPSAGPANCRGGIHIPVPDICYFFSRGNWVAHNNFAHNGGFGNITNGDIANQSSGLGAPTDPGNGPAPDPNCFTANSLTSPSSEWPLGLQKLPCGSFEFPVLTGELVCATGALSLFTNGQVNAACPPGASYPQHDGKCGAHEVATPANGDPSVRVCFRPLSYTLSEALSPRMPDPCAGTPPNVYCAPAPTTGRNATGHDPDVGPATGNHEGRSTSAAGHAAAAAPSSAPSSSLKSKPAAYILRSWPPIAVLLLGGLLLAAVRRRHRRLR